MKFLFFLFPLFVFSQTEIDCAPNCNETPLIYKIKFTPPNPNEHNGTIIISGEDFPNCRENASVTLADKQLQIISINKKEILAKIYNDDYQNGSYKVKVRKTNCRNICGIMDATITDASKTKSGNEFTRRQTSPFSIFPQSYAEVEVACNPDEMAISGGFLFSTWEIKLVSSYPDGRFWRFKVYNNENITSPLNEFYAICVR